MIETVFSNDNEDNNRINRVQAAFKMPKNIRQVGKSNDVKKIYVEDYVMTFVRQLATEGYSGCKAAVLVGQNIKTESCRNIFISGAIEVVNLDMENEIVFTNDTWSQIYEVIKEYFAETEIVGWFLGGPGYLLEDQEKIRKAHINNFAGQDKTLLTYDSMEKEEAFLIYENNRLNKQEGYYIYYEKNEDMQNYMVEHKGIKSEEMHYNDRITKEIRAAIQNKKPAEEDHKGISRLAYASGTLLAIIVLMVGAAMLNNYEQMRGMQETLNSLTENFVDTQEIFPQLPLTSEPTISLMKKGKSESGSTDGGLSGQERKEENLSVNILPGNMEILRKSAEQENLEKGEERKAESKEKVRKEASAKKDPDKAAQGTASAKEQVKTKSKEETKQKVEATAETAYKNNTKKEVKYYTVKKGDTLIGISYKLYKTKKYISKIKKLNDIVDEDYIFEGQRLIIP